MNTDKTFLVYRRLIHDKRISHGAFRFWHYLRDHADKSGKCWPKQRNIGRELRCKTSSLTLWTAQLVNTGYLSTEKIGQNHHFKYTILYGDGNGVMPEWATRGDTQKGDTKTAACSPNGTMATPKGVTPRVSQKDDVSNNKGVNYVSKGNTPPINPQKLFPRELDKAITDQVSAINRTHKDDADALDALWEKLHDLETQKYGHPITKRKPAAPKGTPVFQAPKGFINFWELPEQEQKALKAQLHAAAENPPEPGSSER